MSLEQTGLLRAILEDPHDDFPRLVYADWLDDHGESERAEVIRMQIELPSVPPCACLFHGCGEMFPDNESVGCMPHRRRSYLRRRERDLLQSYAPAWFGSIRWKTHADVYAARATVRGCCERHANSVGCDCLAQAIDWRFERGFVCEVTLPLAAFEAHAKAIFSAHPVTRVTLSDREPYRWFHGRCFWSSEAWPFESSERLPNRLFHLLPKLGPGNDPASMGDFVDRRAAIDALSDACVTYGRALAGLPELRAT